MSIWLELYVTHDWLVLITTNSEYGLRALLNFKQSFTLWLTIKKLRQLVRLWAAQLNVVLAKNERRWFPHEALPEFIFLVLTENIVEVNAYHL